MGQILSSDYMDLYAQPNLKPKPSHHEHLSVRELKELKIITEQEIKDDFDSVNFHQFTEHNNAFGTYYGEMQNKMRQGLGIQQYKQKSQSQTYLGRFHDDKPHGMGLLVNEDNSYYYGLWDDRKCQGDNGLFCSANGDFYCGKWVGCSFEHGFLKHHNYEYIGDMKNGIKHGFGKIIYLDGSSYEGQWENDKMHGYGKLTNGQITYWGQFEYGLRQGMGKQNMGAEEEFLGQFKFDKQNGVGELLNYHTKLQSKGFWMFGEMVGLSCQHSINNQNQNVTWTIKGEWGAQPNDLNLTQNSSSLIKEFEESVKDRLLMNEEKSHAQRVKLMQDQNMKYKGLIAEYEAKIKSWQSLYDLQVWYERTKTHAQE